MPADPDKPKTPKNPFREATASTDDLVECFGVTKQYLGKLATDGVIEKAGRDRWNAFEVVRGFVDMLRNRKVNQHSNSGGGGGGAGEEIDLEVERARKMRADADIAEVQAELLKGRVHEARAVEELWFSQALTCRSRMLGLPSKLASKMPAELAAEVLEIATEVVHEALAQLADYSPERIAERTDKRRLFDPARTADDAAMDAAPEAEPEPVG